VERRYGLAVDLLGDTELAAGRLTTGGYTAFVVPDGAVTAPSPAALAALQAWVRAGGTYAGVRGEGIAYAQSAGITTATASPPSDAQEPGASAAVQLDTTDPVAWGERAGGFVFAKGDPVLHAAGGTVAARYPATGTAAVIDEPLGAGRTVLFAFDPAFRGYSEGTERLLANALLAPPTGAAATRARAVRAVKPVVAPLSEETQP
jgi:hypothetical protein